MLLPGVALELSLDRLGPMFGRFGLDVAQHASFVSAASVQFIEEAAESGRPNVLADRMRVAHSEPLGLEMKHGTAPRLGRFDFNVDLRSILRVAVGSTDRCLVRDEVSIRPLG